MQDFIEDVQGIPGDVATNNVIALRYYRVKHDAVGAVETSRQLQSGDFCESGTVGSRFDPFGCTQIQGAA
jgi:hypothetical protein